MTQKLLFRISNLILALCLLSPAAQAQVWSRQNTFLSIGVGVEVPTGNDLRAVFPPGISTNIGVEINTYKRQLYLKPNAGIAFFNHYYTTSSQESLMQWFAGIDARYYLRPLNDTIIWNYFSVIGISYSGFNNTIGPQPGYMGDVSDMVQGKGLSYLVGLGFIYRRFQVQLAYNWYLPHAAISDEIANILNANAGLYAPYIIEKNKLDLSRFRFEMGVKLPLR